MSFSTTAIFHPLARHVWALGSERLSARVDSASWRYIYLFIFIRLLTMFGPWAPNSYLLALIPPLGDIFIYLFSSACSPCLGPGLRTAICSRRFRLLAIYMFGPWAPNGYLLVWIPPLGNIYIYLFIFIHLLHMFGPWAPNGYLLESIPPLGEIFIYIFIRLLAMFGPWASNGYLVSNPLFGFAALPPHGNIPLALRPCLPSHGEIDFLFASRQLNLHCFGANLPWQLLTFSILQQHTSSAASSTLHIIYVFHTISSIQFIPYSWRDASQVGIFLWVSILN
jgi:hypothetical protein